jgi:hypothetical protein
MQDFRLVGKCGAAKYFKAATVFAGKYPADDSISLVSGMGTEDQQVYTVCLAAHAAPLTPGHVWLKDWSENEGVPQALVDAGIIELTGVTWPAGFCNAVEARLLT